MSEQHNDLDPAHGVGLGALCGLLVYSLLAGLLIRLFT